MKEVTFEGFRARVEREMRHLSVLAEDELAERMPLDEWLQQLEDLIIGSPDG